MSSSFITFVGAGNLAHTLAPALDNIDYAVREVYSLNRKHADGLCQQLYKAVVSDSLDFSNSTSHIFIIAVPDDCVNQVVSEIILPGGAILLHTSGSQPLRSLVPAGISDIGVFYPLQTFSKHRKISLKQVPILIEGSNREVEKVLTNMGKSVGCATRIVDSTKRKSVHVAAVFASNFATHMLSISDLLLAKAGINFQLLVPLIRENLEKNLSMGPAAAQTGPASRGDTETIDNHITWLREVNSDELMVLIYRYISARIVAQSKDEDDHPTVT